MILTNPVLIAVIVLLVLCFLKVNVLLALFASAVTAGLVSGMGIQTTMTTFIAGIGEDPETALAYVMLGALAATISYTGVSDILAVKIAKMVNGKSLVFVFVIGAVACLSQNLIPVHIAFIPILIPPLLIVMNKMKIDRRAVACALAFGLRAPYVAIPAGFGLIYHGIISNNMTKNGMPVEKMEVWRYTWPLGIVMLIGFIFVVLFLYRKPREYKNIEGFAVDLDTVDTHMTGKHYAAVIAAVATLAIQLIAGSLPLGALVGLAIMFLTKAVKWSDMDKIMDQGVGLMGFIAFVMLVAGGFGQVLKDTGAVDALVQGSVSLMGGSKLVAATMITLIGLLVTMGIGTSFGTVPVLAVLYVPLCQQIGFSPAATILLMSAAAALGDAGSPASDTTLGPTSGLNADGQHNHIWDTCVPTFLHYNIPLMIAAIIGAQFL